jgi:Uma2 family endonuclease
LLVIEVSYTTQEIDLSEKLFDYEEAGVEEYWVVDIKKEIVYVHNLEGGKYRKSFELHKGKVESGIIAGFWINVDWLWQRPLPLEPDCLKQII